MEVLLPKNDAEYIIRTVLENLARWPIRSAEAFRNACLGGGMLAINPMLPITENDHVDYIKSAIRNTISEGRMIDFGTIPNQVIIAESIRAREPFENGEFQHPYDSWLGVTSWEGGYNGYYVAPNSSIPDETLVIEIYATSIPNAGDVILIYDMVSIKVAGINKTLVSPASLRFSNIMETEKEQRQRGANSLDPLVTMLRLLADASIPIERIDAPVALNRQRTKHGKFPIPAHVVVKTKDYVASLTASHATGKSRGGHHASPIAHWRRSHNRHLSDGKIIPVRSSRVNWRDNEEMHRLFYRMDRAVASTQGTK